MRLASFSVKNYRSITEAHKIKMGDSTILIGQNNEGKSNLLRALNLAMLTLSSHATVRPHRTAFSTRDGRPYVWSRDFPISLQSRARGLDSIFILEFQLDHDEIIEFKGIIGSTLNGTLPVQIKIGQKGTPEIELRKQGPGATILNKKSTQIANYIAERIEFIYIPAVRTEDETLEVVNDMLSSQLAVLESNQEYIDALEKITALQQPILNTLSEVIGDSLKLFLPGINAVTIKVAQAARRTALRSQCTIEIDDGTPTRLEHKGDGVKSLAALSLLQNKKREEGVSIIAIEEPEAHLHPGAMHSLKDVIMSLSTGNQVVLTTHCPLFVDRSVIKNNILIKDSKAKQATSIEQIRDILGVRASDNLIHASHVLIVEGEEDLVALKAILPEYSQTVSKALKNQTLVIVPIGGASKLPYQLSLLSSTLCVCHVLLDNDDEGRKAYEKAESEGLLKIPDLTLVTCKGFPNSELEDIFEPEHYINHIISEFGVNLNHKDFKGNKKWSDRVKACFQAQGKHWSDGVEAQVKAVVAKAIENKPKDSISKHKVEIINALVVDLEKKLNQGKP